MTKPPLGVGILYIIILIVSFSYPSMIKGIRKIECIICLWVALSAAYFIQGGSWGINARFDLTRAIVERGTLDCSVYSYNSGDFIRVKGKVIPLKAPGVSFLGVPMWGLLHAFGFSGHDATTQRLTLGAYFVNISVSILFMAWAAIWFFRLCLHLRPESILPAACITMFVFSGTLLLPTGTLLLGHVTAAALCWISFARSLLTPPQRLRHSIFSGLLLGTAIAIEYFVLPVVAMIALLTIYRGHVKAWLGLLLGASPALIALAGYHWVMLGAPWRFPYTQAANYFTTEGAFAGLFLSPSFHVIWQTTFGSYRGVFFSSPILILGAIGLYPAWRRGATWRIAAIISGCIVIYHFLFLWTFNGWHGGWTMGSRYFVTAILFLSWPMALLHDRWRAAVYLLGIISMAMMIIATAVNPQVQRGNPAKAFPDPWLDYLFPAFFSGDVADQVQSVDEKFPRYEFWPRGRDYERRARWTRRVHVEDPSTGKRLVLDPNDPNPARRNLYIKLQTSIDDDLTKKYRRFPPNIYNPRHPDAPAGATNWGLLLGFSGLISLVPLVGLWGLLGWWLWKLLSSDLTITDRH